MILTKTRKIDTELLLFEENCIILRKSYSLLVLLIMLIFLYYPVSKIVFCHCIFLTPKKRKIDTDIDTQLLRFEEH